MNSSSERQDAPDAPRRASIPLAHKRVPTEMRAPADHTGLLFAALVGDVDISALRGYVTSLPSESWAEEYNRTHNVFFQRPFHDKLGVENIMCVFSDTQLENVFTLPRYDEFRALLEPIFAQMNVKPEQVRPAGVRRTSQLQQRLTDCERDARWCAVCSPRCRVRRLSPHITTMGEVIAAISTLQTSRLPANTSCIVVCSPWVSKTHRIHVPIVTFRNVRPNASSLTERVGRIM
jgi:hypothetical protein